MLPLEAGKPLGRRLGARRLPRFLTIMYVVIPSDPIYHIARNEHFTLCMLWLSINPEHRKRRSDRRVVVENPQSQFTILCRDCEKKAAEFATSY